MKHNDSESRARRAEVRAMLESERQREEALRNGHPVFNFGKIARHLGVAPIVPESQREQREQREPKCETPSATPHEAPGLPAVAPRLPVVKLVLHQDRDGYWLLVKTSHTQTDDQADRLFFQCFEDLEHAMQDRFKIEKWFAENGVRIFLPIRSDAWPSSLYPSGEASAMCRSPVPPWMM